MGLERIVTIADVIRATYGDDAIDVAARQVEAAEGVARDEWIAILDHLRG